ncbi:BnaA01g30880D [Brassica napus]|uniref:BnaA01g30880D protein n=1 Tax=Brassica napus TaxID=3708 RepID=A0A078HD73_BRANA|nr:BnaA01g30880D [Brassica napus]
MSKTEKSWVVSDSTITSKFGHRPPSTYSMKIQSLSQLKTLFSGTDGYKSRTFSSGKYNWKLVVYPEGNEKDNGTGFVSMYCEFGVDVMVPLTNWEVLKEHCYVSSKILVGGRNWVLRLYPNGLNATYSAWLSLFLHIADDETVKTGEETYVHNSTPNLGWHKFVLLADLEKVYLDKLGSLEVQIQFKAVSSTKYS